MSLLDCQKMEVGGRVDTEVGEEQDRVHLDTYFEKIFGTERDALYLSHWRTTQVPRHATGLVTRRIAMDDRRLGLFVHDVEIILKAERKTRDDAHTEEARMWNGIVLNSITNLCRYDADAEFYESQWVARGVVERSESGARDVLEACAAPSVAAALSAEAARHLVNAGVRRDMDSAFDSERISIFIDQISAWVEVLDAAAESAVRIGHVLAWRAMNDEARDRWAMEREEATEWGEGPKQMMERFVEVMASMSKVVVVVTDVPPPPPVVAMESPRPVVAAPPITYTDRLPIVVPPPPAMVEVKEVKEEVDITPPMKARPSSAVKPPPPLESYDPWWNALDEVRAEAHGRSV